MSLSATSPTLDTPLEADWDDSPEPLPIPSSALPPLDADAERDLKAARVRIGAALPEDGFLGDYVRYCVPLTSAPPEFHLAAGLSVLGAALGNRICDERWGQRFYPSIWIVIVAASSFMKKSTSLNLAERLMDDAGLDVRHSPDGSREGLLTEYGRKPGGISIYDEFGGFLAANKSDYRAGLREDLTTLYGGRNWSSARRDQSKAIVIKRPAINILGATTINWFEDRITIADTAGGFLVRFLYMTADREERATDRDDSQPNAIERNRLIAALSRINKIAPLHSDMQPPAMVAWTPEAKEALKIFMAGWEKEVAGDVGNNSVLDSMASRLSAYVIKLAMLYRVSASAFDGQANPLDIDADSVARAIAFVRLAWKNGTNLFENMATDKDQQAMRMILERIGNGNTRTTVLRGTKMKARDFQEYLNTLIQRDEVVSEELFPPKGVQKVRARKVEWLAPGPAHAKYRS